MSEHDVTELLQRISQGDHACRDELLQLIYKELRRLAARHMQQERANHTLQPTALVHEAYLRLFPRAEQLCTTRAHLFALASVEMRRILVDYARKHSAQKRGMGLKPVELGSAICYTREHSEELLALDAALDKLALIKPDAARLVEMTYFAGLTQLEAASVLGCTDRTVKRHWKFARGFLLEELSRVPS